LNGGDGHGLGNVGEAKSGEIHLSSGVIRAPAQSSGISRRGIGGDLDPWGSRVGVYHLQLGFIEAEDGSHAISATIAWIGDDVNRNSLPIGDSGVCGTERKLFVRR